MYDDDLDLLDNVDSLDFNELDNVSDIWDDSFTSLLAGDAKWAEIENESDLLSGANHAGISETSDEITEMINDDIEAADLSTLDDLNVQYMNLSEDSSMNNDINYENINPQNSNEDYFNASNDIDNIETQTSDEWLDVPLESALHHDLGFASNESQISFGGYYNADGTYHWSTTGENTDSKGNVLYYD